MIDRVLTRTLSTGRATSIRLDCLSEAGARLKLIEDAFSHVELASQGDRIADRAGGVEPLKRPAGAPKDPLHSLINDTGDGAYAVRKADSNDTDQQLVGRL